MTPESLATEICGRDRQRRREVLGLLVRSVWVRWAKEQENPKPNWLLGWDEISESDREVDRRIGEALFGLGYTAGGRSDSATAFEAAVWAIREMSALDYPRERSGLGR